MTEPVEPNESEEVTLTKVASEKKATASKAKKAPSKSKKAVASNDKKAASSSVKSSVKVEAPKAEATAAMQEAVIQTAPVMQAAPVVAASNSGGRGLSVVAILLSLIAIGGTGYSFYKEEIQSRDDDTKLAIKITEIGGNVNRLGDSISRLQVQQDTAASDAASAASNAVSNEQLTTRLLQSKSAVDLQFRDVKESQSELYDAVAKLNDDLGSGVNDFVIGEISQLLKLANNSALFSSDSRSAIRALELADIQLKELADPRYSTVRRKINEEIALLQSFEQIDIESVTVRLKGLANRVPSLALENDVPTVGDVVIETEEKPQGFKAGLKEMMADLVNYNSVQRIDRAPKPLLVPEQRYFLNQNIQLQLAKAELGLVQNRASVYTESLDVATTWLKEYFDLRNDDVKEVLAQISELRAINLSRELPKISGSYSLLQSIKGGQ